MLQRGCMYQAGTVQTSDSEQPLQTERLSTAQHTDITSRDVTTSAATISLNELHRELTVPSRNICSKLSSSKRPRQPEMASPQSVSTAPSRRVTRSSEAFFHEALPGGVMKSRNASCT